MLFSEQKIGPLTLKNRAIRSAAFEGMCPDGTPSQSLNNYHRALAAGGVAMTTIAYMSVSNNGRTFSHQGLMSENIIPQLIKTTEGIHSEGSLASIQLGHGGNMGDKKITGEPAVAPSAVFNLYGLNKPKAMTEEEIKNSIKDYGKAVKIAKEADFDAVEIHAGHGYLISQFLSPYTNRRKDDWGGSLENRTRYLRLIIQEVKKAVGKEMAVLVKMNMEDGFTKGMGKDEALEVAKIIEEEGADAIILSGGFVSKSSFFMMKGKIPLKEIMAGKKNMLIKIGMFLFGRLLVKEYPFEEAYFLNDALKFREALSLPLVYVGGLLSREKIEEVISKGFNFVALARPLVADPDFINKIGVENTHISKCQHCGPGNYCVATMYHGELYCPFEDSGVRYNLW